MAYGHLDENNNLVLAKNYVVVDGRVYVNPSDDICLRANPPEKVLCIEKPTAPPPAGYHYAPQGYTQTDTEVHRIWTTVPDSPPTLADFDKAMEEHLTQERCARGYTTREPDAYLSSANPRWARDAQDWVAHRDAVMEYALGLINAVQSGEREPPTMEEFKAGLPQITWTYEEPAE